MDRSMEQAASAAASTLPLDLVSEIAARSDPVTLVRCAAACRALRGRVANARRLRLRHAGDGRFVPSLLRGFFYQRRDRADGEDPRFVDVGASPSSSPSPEPFRSFLSEYSDLFEFYQPAGAARGGVVALRSVTDGCGAGVCDPMTGLLDLYGSPPGITAAAQSSSYVLLTDDCDGIACRFRLLAADLISGCLRTQAFSSDADAWAGVTETTVPGLPPDATFVRPCALVLAGVAHWLCRSGHNYFILAFSDARSTATVTTIQLDEAGDDVHFCRRLYECKAEELLLVSSPVDGRPSLLVAEQRLEVSLWTPPPSAPDSATGGRWTRQVVIGSDEVRQATTNVLPGMAWSGKLELRWFGEKSGGLLVRMPAGVRGGFSYNYLLDMWTRRIRKVCRLRDRDVHVFFPYEMGLSFWLPRINYS